MTYNSVPEGSPAGITYFINYMEDTWNGLDEARQQFCKDEWVKKASILPDVRVIVLKLVPDTLFPSGEHELPYVYWQHNIVRANDAEYTLSQLVTVKLKTEWTAALQSRIMRDLATKYPSGTVFEIKTHKDHYLSGGRI